MKRVITLPIREILSPAGASILDTFRPAWRLSTDLANWCQRALAIHDTRRQPADAKLGEYDSKCLPGKRSLYQHVNDACPFRDAFDGAAGSLSAVTKAVEDTWRNHPRFGRYAVLWSGEASACVFRWPYPWPVRGQELLSGAGLRREDGHPCASLTLPGGRIEVRLAGGAGVDRAHFARQVRQFDQLCREPGRVCAAKVTGRFKCGKLIGADLRLVGEFDDPPPTAAPNVCFLHTDPNALLVAEINGRSVTVTNGDHIRRAIRIVTVVNEQHKVFLERTRQDKKREVRMDRRQRANLNQAIEIRCEKQRNRIRTAIQQLARQVVRFCQRQRVGAIAYDDTRREYIPCGFDWSALKARLRTLFAKEMGGEWIDGEYVSLTPQERESWLVTARAKAAALAGARALVHANRNGSHPKVSSSKSRRGSKSPTSA